jgi:hypothetical protein
MLYGAEFTQVYANLVGERIVPTPDAKVTDSHKATGTESGRKPARTSDHAA